jgi:L-cysteine S-thiosulfotransferase
VSLLAAVALLTATVVADGVAQPLTPQAGDVARGRAIVGSRQVGLCLLCHSGPFPEERNQGTVSSNLAGAGKRWTQAQLRLRVADGRRLNPDSLMPSFYPLAPRPDLKRVAPAFVDKPILNAQQVEDVVAFLQTLRD